MGGGGTRPERQAGFEGEQPMPPTGEMPVQQ